MAVTRIYNLGGINTYVNPLDQKEGNLIHAVNVDSQPYGAKAKRSGYTTLLGTVDGSAVTSLFSWTKDDGTTLFLYRKSGTSLYYSTQGTGDWTACGNGGFSGEHIGYAILGNTLIMGDGVGSTRHTTNGTSFTNTTLAPVGEHFSNYQNRIYIGGTSSTLFFSTANDATNWSTSGTSDSSSLQIPGAGRINKLMNIANNLMVSKNSGVEYRWDGYNLVDRSTKLGPSSPYSVAEQERVTFYLNRQGIYMDNGVSMQILSNPIQNQIYNNDETGISGSTFGTAAGVVHRYDYFVNAGTITDSTTKIRIPNAILKYDYNKNEFTNFKLANTPTSYHSYKDATGVERLAFGDGSGQCYTLGGTATNDNGVAIDSYMEYVVHLGVPENEKEWKVFVAFFNPGCQAKIAVACENTMVAGEKKWQDLGDTASGKVVFRFPSTANRSSFLFVKIYESSKISKMVCYGFAVDANVIPLQ